MKIIVCGAGLVGRNIARYLAGEGNDITIIDKDPDLVREMTDLYDFRGITGFASHPDVLAAAGAEDTDMIIAVTYSDEVNMVICQVAHSIFEVNDKIARLRSDKYTDAIYADLYRREHMPVDVVISPEQAVSEAITGLVGKTAAFDFHAFVGGKLLFLGMTIDEDCPIINTSLRQLSELFSTFHGIILGLKRDDKMFVPTQDEQLFVGDEFYILVDSADERRAYEIFGKKTDLIKNIVIIGGGEVGERITELFEQAGQSRIKIIEANRDRAEELSDIVNNAIILHGDGLSPSLLEEANISHADAVISVTNDDKINLLTAARAKSMGAKNVLALVNDTSLEGLAKPLSIDSVINPRIITVSNIVRHIRSGRINDVHIVGDNEAEVLEAQVLGSSRLTGRRIKDVEWPDHVRVGAISRAENVMMATGDLVLEEGDLVVVLALRESLSELERLFQVSIDFF